MVALCGWAAVAHNSGSGWVQALGGLLAGFVVVGLGGPAIATARLRVAVLANPTDTTAGHPVTIEVRAGAPLRLQAVVPPGPVAMIGSGAGRVELVPARRGPLREVTLVLGSAAPFGLSWWRKTVVVPLARPLWVAPVSGTPDPGMLAASTPGATLDHRRPRDARVGEPRGVRPYVAGDPRRLVHWPATAHRGELMVREAERPEAAVPEVRVVLPDDGPEGDAVAERALGTVLALLARSSPVMLATAEADGLRTEAVYGPADAGRRLARAVAAQGEPQ
jgi:uncharacterized protein (DUF58 family)